MRRRLRNIAFACIIWTGIAGATISAIIAGMAATTELESRAWPVVTGWRAEATREPGGQTVLRVQGVKRRACKYLGEDMAVRGPDGPAHDVAHAWIDDPTPGSSRPEGGQDFGAMRVFTSRATPAGSTIVGVARHQCHAGPETLTSIEGPGFVVPSLPAP